MGRPRRRRTMPHMSGHKEAAGAPLRGVSAAITVVHKMSWLGTPTIEVPGDAPRRGRCSPGEFECPLGGVSRDLALLCIRAGNLAWPLAGARPSLARMAVWFERPLSDGIVGTVIEPALPTPKRRPPGSPPWSAWRSSKTTTVGMSVRSAERTKQRCGHREPVAMQSTSLAVTQSIEGESDEDPQMA